MMEVCPQDGLTGSAGLDPPAALPLFILASIPLLALPGDKTQEFALRLLYSGPNVREAVNMERRLHL